MTVAEAVQHLKERLQHDPDASEALKVILDTVQEAREGLNVLHQKVKDAEAAVAAKLAESDPKGK